MNNPVIIAEMTVPSLTPWTVLNTASEVITAKITRLTSKQTLTVPKGVFVLWRSPLLPLQPCY